MKKDLSSDVSTGFGGGAVGLEEWRCLRRTLRAMGCRVVVEIGGGFSSYLLSLVTDHVITLEDDPNWAEQIKKMTVDEHHTVMTYKYPDFPALLPVWPGHMKDALVFVDGPLSSRAGDGRRAAMEWAKKNFDRIALHDAGRNGEKQNIKDLFEEDEWMIADRCRGLLILSRKK